MPSFFQDFERIVVDFYRFERSIQQFASLLHGRIFHLRSIPTSDDEPVVASHPAEFDERHPKAFLPFHVSRSIQPRVR